MNKKRFSILSTGLVLIAIFMLAGSVHATGMWNFDEKHGPYTTVQVGVAGNMNWLNGRLYSPAAYVKGVVDENITGGYNLVVHYYFEWEDLNHVTHYQNGIATIPGIKGHWVRIDCTGLPSAVYYIAADGYNSYDSVNDTEMASASLPML